MDKAKAKALSTEVDAALQAIAERNGLSVKVGGGSYDAGSFRPKVEFKEGDADASEFAQFASMYGLKPEDFGRQFIANGKLFKVSGLAIRSPKRPVLATQVSTGRVFKFDDDTVAHLLRISPEGR